MKPKRVYRSTANLSHHHHNASLRPSICGYGWYKLGSYMQNTLLLFDFFYSTANTMRENLNQPLHLKMISINQRASYQSNQQSLVNSGLHEARQSCPTEIRLEVSVMYCCVLHTNSDDFQANRSECHKST